MPKVPNRLQELWLSTDAKWYPNDSLQQACFVQQIIYYLADFLSSYSRKMKGRQGELERKESGQVEVNGEAK